MHALTADTSALLATLPVFDAHVDSLQRQLDLDHDLGTRTSGHLDLVRGRQGGLGAVVLVNWVDPKHIEHGGARQRTLDLLRQFHVLLARHARQLAWAGNGELLRAARASGRIGGIPGIEGGHSIEGRLEHLHEFHALGVRVMTLVWNNHLAWIRSCQPGAGADVPEGLNEFGRSVVRAMNELGMVVDVSHAGERSFYDVLDASAKPVIASHSGCKALHGHQRNLTDDQLRALAAHGGVVGIVFCTAFLKDEAQAEDARLRETPEYKAITGPNDTDVFLRQGEFLQRAAKPLSMEVVLDHVCHAVEVAGISHVGLGSDYDGIGRTPEGLEDASCYGRIAAGLAARGFARDDVRRILGGNMERVFGLATGAGTRAATAELAPFAAASTHARS
ncbi:MAG: membrane dipeptidase [Planctomycetes bacterium]|nr:membrane dipeptidase [Planctomycetota bacterium]